MTLPSEIPGLPDQAHYLSSIKSIDTEIGKHEGVQRYLARYQTDIARAPTHRSFRDAMNKLAAVVEPVDRSTVEFVDPTKQASKALALGSVAGLIVAREVHGDVVRVGHLFDAMRFPIGENDGDILAYRHELGAQVIELGDQGMSLAGEQAADIVEGWEMQAVPDVTKQHLFRVGMGIVALGAYTKHEALLEEQRERKIEVEMAGIHDFDWDAAAQEFFK